jgi:hypothetical protein
MVDWALRTASAAVAFRMAGAAIVALGLWACNDRDAGSDGKAASGGKGGANGGSGATGGTNGGSNATGGAAATGGGANTGGQGGTGGDGSGGTSGAGGSGNTGPCRGLECDQTTCTMGNCTQMPCPTGTSTTVSGTVRDPAGKIPLYNVLVYVPNGPVAPVTEGASCLRCEGTVTDPVTSTRTSTDGQFVLPDAPVGASIPLVIQTGKWRRQITVSNVTRCADRVLTDIEQTSLPSKKSEGDMPLIAVATGGGDSMECLPRRMGVEDAEFTHASGNGRIHLYAGTDSASAVATQTLDSGQVLDPAEDLWSSLDALRRYDIVILSCEADSMENPRASSARQALHDYMSIGGKVLASHWHHRWVSAAPELYPDVATFSDRENPEDPASATVSTTSVKGQALAQWLVNAGASTVLGQVDILAGRDNVQAVNASVATEWVSLINSNENDTRVIPFFSFGMPLEADESGRCGSFAYADLEVSNAVSTGMPVDSPGDPFPSHCTVRDLTAQEKVAEFLLFELSSCF